MKQISHSLIFATGSPVESARKLQWIMVCALMAAAAVGLALVDPLMPLPTPGPGTQGTAMRGEVTVQPLTIDPMLTRQMKIMAPDGVAFDRFGSAAALSGDTAVIGAPSLDAPGGNQGSAYVFVRSGAVWTLQQKLTADDGEAGDGFGHSVAIIGDTLVVGAPNDDIGEKKNQGSAYVFVRSGGVWTKQQKLIADDGAASDSFGFSIAFSGDTVAVGAISKSGAFGRQGAAYVFTRSGATWTKQQLLTANDGAAGDEFGYSVAISGDTVVVGASIDTIGGNSDQGSAYVFVRSGTVWTQQQKLTAADGQAGDQFGSSVSVSGDTIVVGAPLGDIVDKIDQGSAYVFVRSGAVWTLQQKLTADDGEARDSFSISVALSGDTVAIGAYIDKIGENIVQGSAYIFVRSGATWAKQQKLTANDGEVGDQFGSSVAVSGDTVLVGAFSDKIGENFNQGSAYVFVSAGPLACVSAASFARGGLAPESIVAAFGGGLAKTTEVLAGLPLPTTLGGARVRVFDSAGTERFAPLFFVSPAQINFLVPPGTAAGQALVTVITDDQTVATESPQIVMVLPGLFSANSTGQGLVAGLALRVKADQSRSFEPLVQFDQGSGQFMAAPIDLGPATDQVFLVMFATGLRNRSGLGAVSVKIGGVSAEALYAGPQGTFDGLDQLNVALPRSLAGRGEVDVNVTVDGVAANALKVAIR